MSEDKIICPVCKAYLGKISTPGADSTKIMKHMDKTHPKHCYCGQSLKGHKRCALCGIYIGPRHYEQESQMLTKQDMKMPSNIKVKCICICGFCIQLLKRRPPVAVQCGLQYLKNEGEEVSKPKRKRSPKEIAKDRARNNRIRWLEKENDAVHSRSGQKEKAVEVSASTG